MKYLDANVFLYAIDGPPALRDSARAKLAAVIRGQQPASTSTLTVDEFTWALMKTVGRQIAIREAQRITRMPRLRIEPVHVGHVRHALELMNKSSLKPRDAIHAADAIDIGPEAIISSDDDFDEVERLRRQSLS